MRRHNAQGNTLQIQHTVYVREVPHEMHVHWQSHCPACCGAFLIACHHLPRLKNWRARSNCYALHPLQGADRRGSELNRWTAAARNTSMNKHHASDAYSTSRALQLSNQCRLVPVMMRDSTLFHCTAQALSISTLPTSSHT